MDRHFARSRRGGFTLIELMIVVAIVGVLSAIAIPSFIGFMRRSKTSEAATNLKMMFEGAAAYYSDETWDTRAVQLVGGALAIDACTVAAINSPNIPSNQKSVVDWQPAALQSFQDIGFQVVDPIYYQYQIVGSTDSCSHVAGENLYSFRAVGDLDFDGTTSLFELSAGSNTSNLLMRTPGIYRVNATE